MIIACPDCGMLCRSKVGLTVHQKVNRRCRYARESLAIRQRDWIFLTASPDDRHWIEAARAAGIPLQLIRQPEGERVIEWWCPRWAREMIDEAYRLWCQDREEWPREATLRALARDVEKV